MMLSGIFTSSILVSEFPATLRLGVWFHCQAAPGTYEVEAKLQIDAAKSKPVVVMGRLSLTVPPDGSDPTEAAFGIGGAMVQVMAPGTFKAFYRVVGEKRWTKVIEKIISLLPSPQPQTSLQSQPAVSSKRTRRASSRH
jgi:hypothetical protein